VTANAVREVSDGPSFRSRKVTFEEFQGLIGELQLRKEKRSIDEWLKEPGIARKVDGTVKTYIGSTSGQAFSPEASDGSSLLDLDDEPNPMKAVLASADSDGAGAVTSTNLIAAGSGGQRHIIYEMEIRGAPLAGGTTFSALFNAAISDVSGLSAIQCLAGSARILGPFKQTTVDTAIAVSVGAGGATASSRYQFSIRYRTVTG